MPKLEKRVQEILSGKIELNSLPEDEKWCIYMKYRHERQAEPLIKELCRKEEGIMRAEKSLGKVNRSFLKYLREMDYIKNEMERHSRIEAAHNEGLALGRAEGHTKGRAEGRSEGRSESLEAVARKMKTSGRQLNEIIEFTGLSAERIEALD